MTSLEPSRKITYKQSLSAARDVHLEYTIDRAEQTVLVQMATAGGHEIISTDALVDLVRRVLPVQEITAYIEDVEDSPSPIAAPWDLMLSFGGRQLPVRAVRQITGSVVVEILPSRL